MAESLKDEDEKMLQMLKVARNLSISDDGIPPSETFSKDLQCPLTWRECLERFDDTNWVRALKFGLSKESHDWRDYCLRIMLGCVLTHLEEEEEAATMFNTCEELLERNKNEKFFVDIIEGLEHILLSSRLHFLRMTGRKDAAEEIFHRIKNFMELNKECQAAVFATKAHILRQFEYDAMHEGLKCARLAIELDPDEFGFRRGAWYCLAGKIMAEIRHTESFDKLPSNKEVQLLERAMKKNPFPSHFSYMADTYREIVKAQRRSTYKLGPHYHGMLQKAKEMYEICVKEKCTPAAVLANCGSGLIKLPNAYQNVSLAKEAFEKAMNSGSKKATYGMGNLLNWRYGDYKEALKYYEKAYSEGVHKAGLEIIKMKYNIDKNYNPLEDCDKFIKNLECLLEARQRKESTVAYHMLKADYLLVKKKDLLSAAKEWKIALDCQCDSKFLWDAKCFFKESFSGLKVSNVLCMEIRKTLEQRKLAVTDEKYLLKIFEEFPPHCKYYENKMSWRNRELIH